MLREISVSLLRGLRLRCPAAATGRCSRRPSGCTISVRSATRRFEREPGQWLGAVYVNLALTLGLVAVGIVLTQTFTSLSTAQQVAIWTPLAGIGPFVFYRASKGIWTSIIFIGEGLYIPWPNR